jgi:hypothetical protein
MKLPFAKLVAKNGPLRPFISKEFANCNSVNEKLGREKGQEKAWNNETISELKL